MAKQLETEGVYDEKYEDNALSLNKGFLVDIKGYFKLILSFKIAYLLLGSLLYIKYWED